MVHPGRMRWDRKHCKAAALPFPLLPVDILKKQQKPKDGEVAKERVERAPLLESASSEGGGFPRAI